MELSHVSERNAAAECELAPQSHGGGYRGPSTSAAVIVVLQHRRQQLAKKLMILSKTCWLQYTEAKISK
uniref:Uncharacterized protein n=1 Tax=Physcomitrium patens TaxID=3218 RepID=A0A2K1L1F5_PHYPA|nr:hypothetical protein PHYPA_002648 [Physcomitrium patens]